MELNAYLSTSTAPRHPPPLGWKGTVLQPSAPSSPKQVQEGGRSAVAILLLALAPCQSGKGGAMKQGSTHSTPSLLPQNRTEVLNKTGLVSQPDHVLQPESLLFLRVTSGL